jgi:Family of unknown function (DUF5678)
MKVDLHTSELLQFQADHLWIDQNREMLLARYPDQWIAVQDNQVIASDPEFEGLLAKLPDPSRTCVEFMTPEPIEIVV